MMDVVNGLAVLSESQHPPAGLSRTSIMSERKGMVTGRPLEKLSSGAGNLVRICRSLKVRGNLSMALVNRSMV